MKTKANIICLIGILLISLLQLCPYPLLRQVDRDSISYLSHAFTIGLDFDLDYSNEPSPLKSGNKKVASHPMGPGIMAAPFVAFFSIFDHLTGNAVIQDHSQYSGSWAYFGFLFSTIFYYFSGIFLYYKGILKIKLISPGIAFLILSSSGAAYFALNLFTMGHSFEFFLFGAIFWCTVSLWHVVFDGHGSPRRSLTFTALHACSAFAMIWSLMVRPANLNVLLLPPILLLGLLTLKNNTITWNLFRKHIFSIYAWTLLLAVPFFIFNYSIYESIYPTFSDLYFKADLLNGLKIDDSNIMRTVLSTITQVIDNAVYLPKVLFGSEFGLLYSNPLIITGLGLLIYQIVKSASIPVGPRTVLVIAVLICYALPFSVVLLWKSPGGSYGYRYLLSLFPIGLIGYMLWNKRFNRGGLAAKTIHRLVVLLSVVSIASEIFFGITPALTHGEKLNSFGVYTHSSNGYQFALIEEIFNPHSWMLLFAKRTPGFVAFNFAQYVGADPSDLAAYFGIRREYLRITTNWRKEYGLDSLISSPGTYLLQVLVLFLLISTMAFFYCRVYVKNPNFKAKVTH